MMFFTDDTKVESASLDGDDRRVLVDTHLNQVSGITVDIPGRRVYFCDAKIDRIESIAYDGSDRQVVVRGKRNVPHAFGITLFDERVYWTDWALMGVRYAEKFGEVDTSVNDLWAEKISGLYPMGIAAYHKSRQLTTQNSTVNRSVFCTII